MGFTGLDIEVTNGLRIKENTSYSKELLSSEGVLGEAYVHSTFQGRPVCFNDAGYGDPTGTTGDENCMRADGQYFEYHILGAGQTILCPAWVSGSGLNISMDQTSDEGAEYTNGIGASSPTYFDVSVDNFFFEVSLNIEDISGVDDLCVGFRKAEAYQANVDDYDEAAYFCWDGANLDIETILNGGNTSNTDTGGAIAEGSVFTLRVECVDRVVSFKYNGNTPDTTVSFTFDANEKVIPFLYFLHTADVAGTIYLTKWECGKLLPAVTA